MIIKFRAKNLQEDYTKILGQYKNVIFGIIFKALHYIFWKLQFECDPTSVMDAIIQVDEPQSCQYVITVLTSKICAIPHLRPPPVHKPVKIECRPLLTSTEYEKYQNMMKEQAA